MTRTLNRKGQAHMNDKKKSAGNVVNINASALPDDRSQALRILIRLSEQLVQLADRETQALVQDDIRSFAILQDEKEKVSTQYERAAGEFHVRLEEFRGSDPALLNRLEKLQEELGEKTKSNTKIVERMFRHSQQKVHNNLISVQELAQIKPLSIEETKD